MSQLVKPRQVAFRFSLLLIQTEKGSVAECAASLGPFATHQKGQHWASRVVQWPQLPTTKAGGRLQALIRELDPTCCNEDTVQPAHK